jgi:hypothetical protein
MPPSKFRPGTSTSVRNAGILFGVADCELHMFVEADRQKRVKRYIWGQFEAFLDSAKDGEYQYSKGEMAKLWGAEFNVRARFGSNEIPKAESDAEHAFNMIKKAGFTLPSDLMNVRFLHILPETQSRKELMVIYGEHMELSKFTFADFVKDNQITEVWKKTEPKLIERAKKAVKIEFKKYRTSEYTGGACPLSDPLIK